MKKQAIDKAKKRLEEARNSLLRVRSTQNWDEFEVAWGVFLKAAKCVPEILREGAKQSQASKTWFGKKVVEMKGDEFLSYMHEARNVEEHGIEPIAQDVAGSITIPGGRHGTYFDKLEIINGQITQFRGHNLDGTPLVAIVQPNRAQLIPVTNKDGKVFNLPTGFLGQNLTDQPPAVFGELWLTYFEQMLSEAEDLVGV